MRMLLSIIACLGCTLTACSSSSSGSGSPSTPNTQYRPEAQLRVSPASSDTQRSVAALATSADVLRNVREDLALDLSVDELKAKVSAHPVGSAVVVIVVTDSDANRAAQIANADATSVIDAGRRKGLQLSVAQPATPSALAS